MLISVGKTSCGDFGEESLVGRFLLALVFNEYASVNEAGARAFRQFWKRCLGIDVAAEDIKRSTATVEFQVNRCRTGGDQTTFDALITLEDRWLWGIEVKYFASLEVEQIERELRSAQILADGLEYPEAGVLFITSEQQLGTCVLERDLVFQCLARACQAPRPVLALATWEMIFEIIIETGPRAIREELQRYCELRNQNVTYPDRLSISPRIGSGREWLDLITGRQAPPSDLPRRVGGASASFSRFGRASSTMKAVFRDGFAELAQMILDRSQFEPKAQDSGYVNLSKAGRAHAQLHPQRDGVALVVREVDEVCPRSRLLPSVAVKELNGYRGSNKTWLDGNGKRFTQRPAGAWLVPPELANDSSNPAWKEVDALLEYAYGR